MIPSLYYLYYFLAFLFGLIVCGSLLLIIYARRNYGSLEGCGIPVVKPHWLLGSNYNDPNSFIHWEDLRRTQELGPVYGVYDGRSPIVFISDIALIQKITLTESHHFSKREHDFGHPIINQNMEFLNGEKWRTLRNWINPQFTPASLKLQFPLVHKITQEYVDTLVERADKGGRVWKLDAHEFVAPFAVQVIGEVTCGIKIDSPQDPNNEFVKTLRAALFDGLQGVDFIHVLLQTFPFLSVLLPKVDCTAINMIRDSITEILNAREKSGVQINDFIGMLLSMRTACGTKEFQSLGITDTTMFAQGFTFFIASFFGMTSTARELFYFLVTNPEIYARVQEEIDGVLEKRGELSYEAIGEMEYLQACIYETLRIAPAFIRPDRTCIMDWKCGDIEIKKGTHVAFPLYAIHHNPDFYPNPKEFNPERFYKEAKNSIPSGAFLAFGQGQRQCVGIRLSIQIIKVLFAKLLSTFKLERREDTVWKEKLGGHALLLLEPIYVDLLKREEGKKFK